MLLDGGWAAAARMAFLMAIYLPITVADSIRRRFRR